MRHLSLSSTGMMHRTTSGVRIDCSSSLVPTSLPLHCQQLSACRTETRTIATNYSLLFRRLSLYLTSMGYITTCAVRLAHAHASCYPSCWYPAIRDWLQYPFSDVGPSEVPSFCTCARSANWCSSTEHGTDTQRFSIIDFSQPARVCMRTCSHML